MKVITISQILTKQILVVMGLTLSASISLRAEESITNRYDLVSLSDQANGQDAITRALETKNSCNTPVVGMTYESFLSNVVKAREMLDSKATHYDQKVDELKNYCTDFFNLRGLQDLWKYTSKPLEKASSPALRERGTMFQLAFRAEERLVKSCKAFETNPAQLMAVSNDINHLLYLYSQDHLKANLWLRVKGYDTRPCLKDSKVAAKGDGLPLLRSWERESERTFNDPQLANPQ